MRKIQAVTALAAIAILGISAVHAADPPKAGGLVCWKDKAGKTVNWNFELASPNVLVRNGWTRNSLKQGDEITVQGSQAKDGSFLANARSVVLATGKKVFAGSSQEQGN